MSNVVVVGCGQIGLPLALAFAESGVRVLGVDTHPGRLAALVAGRLEPDHESLTGRLREALASGLLVFTDVPHSMDAQRAFIVTVPTPVDAQRRFIREPLDRALATVTAVAADDDLVVIRSTVPIGTTRSAAAKASRRFRWAACPDRSVAGRAFADQFEIPHIVSGLDARAREAALVLFSVLGEVRPVASPETAEALKLFANVQRDTAFALANQFALICEDVGVDFAELREAGAAGLPHFTMARPGPVGGPCLSKDVFLLLQPASGQEFGAELLLAARAVNARLVGRFSAAIRADLAAAGGGTVAILGLAFKGRPPVSDRADSFGVALQAELIAAEISVKTWDPVSDPPEARASAIEGADVVVLANDHHALVDISDIARESPGCVVYDICGTADRRSASDLVLRVFGDGATRR